MEVKAGLNSSEQTTESFPRREKEVRPGLIKRQLREGGNSKIQRTNTTHDEQKVKIRAFNLGKKGKKEGGKVEGGGGTFWS